MVKTEAVTINGKEYTHTYSDAEKYIVRDGISYEEAYDPSELGRTYEEGDSLPDITNEEVFSILMGDTE